MSYELVKQIKVEDDKVLLTTASSNVTPRYYSEWECKGLTQILQEKGKEILDLKIMQEYENGNFQGFNNKYVKALLRLVDNPEYSKFNWRRNDIDYSIIRDNRDNHKAELNCLMLEALKT